MVCRGGLKKLRKGGEQYEDIAIRKYSKYPGFLSQSMPVDNQSTQGFFNRAYNMTMQFNLKND
ncbi:MAG: hypothetical protein CM15mV42_0900 [uncultured marine virus]|nr:MAG: hypothetical protein CM15mV42_0900 [uncultured marine virus]